MLGSSIEFKLAKSKQPKSTIVAEQRGKDYPCTITFNVIFDSTVGKVKLRNLAGQATGKGMMRIPPDGTDILSVSKPEMKVGDLNIVAIDCASMPIPEKLLLVRKG